MIGAFVQISDHFNASAGWVLAENGCHIWVGYITPSGYGRLGHSGRLHLAHRFRYEQEIGPVPDGMELDHYVCNTRSCCNPLHVRPVTHRENVLRSDNHMSHQLAQTHCKRGHPLAGYNLDRYDLAMGNRRCIKCRNIRRKERAEEKAALSTDDV